MKKNCVYLRFKIDRLKGFKFDNQFLTNNKLLFLFYKFLLNFSYKKVCSYGSKNISRI